MPDSFEISCLQITSVLGFIHPRLYIDTHILGCLCGYTGFWESHELIVHLELGPQFLLNVILSGKLMSMF